MSSTGVIPESGCSVIRSLAIATREDPWETSINPGNASTRIVRLSESSTQGYEVARSKPT